MRWQGDISFRKGFCRKGLGRFMCLSLFLLSAAAALPARAENTDARLNSLENEIQTLSRAVFKGEAPPPGAADSGTAPSAEMQANINNRLSQLESDLRALTGQVERQAFEQRKLREDMERRLSALEAGAGAAAPVPVAPPAAAGGFVGGAAPAPGYPPVLTAQAATPVPPPAQAGDGEGAHAAPPVPADQVPFAAAPGQQLGTLPAGSAPAAPLPPNAGPTEYYENAYGLLKDQRYDEAEKAFQAFLDKYPDDNLASNARYWLGETFYVRKDYERAARIFAEVYQKYPKGPKGPDSLLKLGMSLAAMGKKSDACLTYSQLTREYPVGADATLDRARGEMQALNCAP
jgi:tol-pal system protein YbgF